jgi:hypothetical protein
VSLEMAVCFCSGSTAEKGLVLGLDLLVSCSKHATSSDAFKAPRPTEPPACRQECVQGRFGNTAAFSDRVTLAKSSQLKPCVLPPAPPVLGADAAAVIWVIGAVACLLVAPGGGTGTTGDSVLGTICGAEMLGLGGGCTGLLGMLNLNNKCMRIRRTTL